MSANLIPMIEGGQLPGAKPHGHMTKHERFRVIARSVSHYIGSPVAFAVAVLVVVIWASLGPMFGFSDTWQLVINTSTTIVTFLVVFLIQNSQNHDARALHLKLDELLRALKNARSGMISLEDLPDEEISRLEDEFRNLRGGAPGVTPRKSPPSLGDARR